MAAPRYPEKFTSLDGTTTVYTFPLGMFEFEPSQPLRDPVQQVMGTSRGFRMLGTATALQAQGSVRIRAIANETSSANLDAEVDELRADLYTVGLGKLWSLGADGSRRWCYASLSEMPTYTLTPRNLLLLPVVFGFMLFSDWFGETAITHTETVTSSPDTFTVNNPGNLPATIVEIRLRANANPGFTNPKIENLTAVSTPFGSVLYTFETARDGASSNDEVRLFTGSPAEAASVKRSTDNGSSYADDFAQLVIGTAHRVLAFALAPGDNSIKATIGGTANVDVQITAYAPFA
ncbi:MAG: hypothetical protein AB7P33_09890 [Dehalococcoidia bacterium]